MWAKHSRLLTIWYCVSWLPERSRNWPRIAESSVLPGLLEAAATPCWRSLSSLWEKNDRKHTCREEKVDRRGRLKTAAIIYFTRGEPSRIRRGSGRAREAKPPTVPMNSTADPNSDFPWKKTFVLLFELRYPSSLKGFVACFKNLLRLLYACKLGVFVSVFIRILLLIVLFFCDEFATESGPQNRRCRS